SDDRSPDEGWPQVVRHVRGQGPGRHARLRGQRRWLHQGPVVTVVAFLIGLILGATLAISIGWHHYIALRFDRRIWAAHAPAKGDAAHVAVRHLTWIIDHPRAAVRANRIARNRARAGMP